MTPDPGEVYGRILADMKMIWGEMASAMLRKRLRDVSADAARLTADQLRAVSTSSRRRRSPPCSVPRARS